MRKIVFQAIFIVLMGLFIYSCSELILPKQVGVKGTLDMPIRAGAVHLGSMIAQKVEEVFSGEQEGTKVYNVEYAGQEVQTSCIYIPIEMTEDLNPDNFLKTIDDQINGGINMTPKEINVPIPPGSAIPISDIQKLLNGDEIPSVSLATIAGYVRNIDFDKCNKDDDLKGIGLNFYIKEKIPEGLKMVIKCNELHFSSAPVSLKQYDNIFGNKDGEFTLALDASYQNDTTKLKFTVELSAEAEYDGKWHPVYVGGATHEIKGEMRLFRNWTQAEIDLAKALKASGTEDNEFGKFPAEAFDLSKLKLFFDGGFTFNGLEVEIYMDGPDLEKVKYLGSKLLLKAQYSDKTGSDEKILYHDNLSVSREPIKLNDYLNIDINGNKFYKKKDLPGNTAEDIGKIDKDIIANIFKTMPTDLSFIFTIETENNQTLIITPEAFKNTGASSGAIKTTMMIMLPMSLTATGNDDGSKSIVSFPGMFDKDDLFGREKPEDLFSEADVEYIKMTIDFFDKIFTKGDLFINKKKEVFPQGIRLNGKEMVLIFTDEQVKEIKRKLIKPDIRIEFEKGGRIDVPKNTGIVSIKIEMKGVINIGEL